MMGYVPPPLPGYREGWQWRELDSFAAKVAAPVWALVWLLTLGRMGKPLRRTIHGGAAKPQPPLAPGVVKTANGSRWIPGSGYQPTHGCDSSNPPQGGSGVPRSPTPPPASDDINVAVRIA